MGELATAGERLTIASELDWVARLVEEGAAGELRPRSEDAPSIVIVVEADQRPFPTSGANVLSRDAWSGAGTVVVRNVCGSGFDLAFEEREDDLPMFTFRWRPPHRERLAARALRARFHLLARAVLMQYPAMWWAGTKGRVPLHAPAYTTGSISPLLVGPGGVGKSTLLGLELQGGGRAVSDNVSVGDGTTVWGLAEPARAEGGTGRRMYHGRGERAIRGRISGGLEPDRVVVVRRANTDVATVRPCDPALAARSLVAGTYMAGELRRYWTFAATFALGTGRGPSYPNLGEVALAFTQRLPCFEVVLPRSASLLPTSLSPEMEAACR